MGVDIRKTLMFNRSDSGAIMKALEAKGFPDAVARKAKELVEGGAVLLHGQRDAHTHPALQGILLEATNCIFLGETTDRGKVLEQVRQRAKEQGSVYAFGFAYGSGVTMEDLKEFEGFVFLQDTAMHGGVVNPKLLAELKRRTAGLEMHGECLRSGKVTEDYNFLAIAIIEEQFADKAVDAVERWMEKRICEGTTAFNDKVILTPTEAEVLKQAVGRIKARFGYNPLKSAHLFHPLFMSNPEILETLREIAPLVGVKWVNDGGTRNATLKALSFADGSKGDNHSIPIPMNYREIKSYINLLKEHGVRDLAWHAIGDGTVKELIGFAPLFLAEGISVGIEHFQLVTDANIVFAASIGIPLRPSPNYTTEAFRPDYAQVLGETLCRIMNPLRIIADRYDARGRSHLIELATDGMPQSMLFAIACATSAPNDIQRLTLDEALYHSRDEDSLIVVPESTLQTLKGIDMKQVVSNGRIASLADELNGSPMLVANKERVLHERKA